MYALVEWDPERFGIGVKQIDDQHRQLLKLINSLSFHLSADLRATQANIGINGVVRAVVEGSKRPDSSNSLATYSLSPRTDSAMESSSDRNSMPLPSPKGANTSKGTAPLIAKLGFTENGPKRELAPSPAAHLRNFPRKFQAKSDVGDVVDQLVTFAQITLANEDHLLETYGYGERESQFKEHAMFADRICRVHRLMESYSAQQQDLERLLKFLKVWIAEHVRSDRRYAPLLIEKGGGV